MRSQIKSEYALSFLDQARKIKKCGRKNRTFYPNEQYRCFNLKYD
ncbi:hypothetical protein [Volucribacter psittacicida]|nr:hypothetical protein [Volucribacter psittacicida]